MILHSQNRKRELDKMFSLCLSVSNDRVLTLQTFLGNHVCERYRKENVLCPPNLCCGLFTVAAGDNMDHNPSPSGRKFPRYLNLIVSVSIQWNLGTSQGVWKCNGCFVKALESITWLLWFKSGYFVVRKSTRDYSPISDDQAHKQYNAIVKGNGGIIGITQDQKALTR